MKSVLKSKIFDEEKLILKYTKDFKSGLLIENTKHISQNGIKGTIHSIQLNGVYIDNIDIELKNHYEIEVLHDFPLFKLHFEIEGSNKYTPYNTLSLPIQIPSGHYNLFYLPEVNGKLSYQTKKRKTLEIKFTKSYIKKILGNSYKNTLQDLGKCITEQKPYVMWEKSLPIDASIHEIINKISTCNYPSPIKKAFLESLVTELLTMLFAKKLSTKKEYDVISKDEIKKIKLVENYIKANYKKKITIPELATIGGLNTTKLKYNFKHIYATTIFKYITHLRMEKAKSLIIHQNYSISQASLEVGYKNPQHFTVAFKKLYGYLPSKLITN
ncbi:AraC family transcriptional regulator [Tenacibaculum sp. IB213877]|uniref:helix-turn-helix domain-containing protein n=1 Tax=Tenacibaculum sp. IB213877 TaxID=3097351 RepID=UPI002A5ADDB1|nr:AraC family transcriptional regulator [Tenacibaculum sp. IB213877]MDY0780986.1 AraC family transcriptional regulator [Tenacibaculum sp. IB213877]